MRIKEFINNLLAVSFVRFAIVGVVATAVHYGIYYLLFRFINVNIAYTTGYLISLCMNFFLTAHFTFRTGTNVKRGAGFVLSHMINYVLHIILLNFFLWLGIPKAWAPVPVFCIAIPVNFLLVRFVFSSKHFR